MVNLKFWSITEPLDKILKEYELGVCFLTAKEVNQSGFLRLGDGITTQGVAHGRKQHRPDSLYGNFSAQTIPSYDGKTIEGRVIIKSVLGPNLYKVAPENYQTVLDVRLQSPKKYTRGESVKVEGTVKTEIVSGRIVSARIIIVEK